VARRELLLHEAQVAAVLVPDELRGRAGRCGQNALSSAKDSIARVKPEHRELLVGRRACQASLARPPVRRATREKQRVSCPVLPATVQHSRNTGRAALNGQRARHGSCPRGCNDSVLSCRSAGNWTGGMEGTGGIAMRLGVKDLLVGLCAVSAVDGSFPPKMRNRSLRREI
jgi:hypothetical protein